MITSTEVLTIKNMVINVLEEEKDIISIYISEGEGGIISREKIVRGESRIEAIILNMLTKTRVGIAIKVKVSPKANVPHLYRFLEKKLREQFSIVKVNLYSLNIEKHQKYIKTSAT